MWWKSAIFLLSLIFLISQVKSQEISCNYINRGGVYPYTCQLTINNPEGSNDFTSIPGNHVEGFTDADVLLVDSFGQNSRNIPSVICRQFPNLRDLYFAVNNVEVIDETSFADCENLVSTILLFNSIRRVPANTFRNNRNLEFIYLNWNGLEELNQDSFRGSAARFIDLEFNNLGAGSQNGLFRGSWFDSVASTLHSLSVMGNNLQGIEVNAFSNLRNLAWLDMTANPLLSVSESSFNGLTGMRDLYLIQCNLTVLNPVWFRDMPLLEDLHIEFNQISELPAGIFANLESLTNLYLGYNNLTEMSIAPLGETAFNLIVLSLTQNQVDAIEPELFDRLENINSIEMTGNVCNQQNIVNIQQNRAESRIRLRRCLDNFGPRFIECRYSSIGGNYACTLSVRNNEGEDFTSIAGNHLSERFDEDVVLVYGSYQNTRILPPVICRQFPATETIMILSSYIEVINEDSFRNCVLLQMIHLDFNEITAVPDNTFRNNPSLTGLFLNANRIRDISDNSLTGTQISFLDLGNNWLQTVNSNALASINSTLTILELFHNLIGTLPSNAFENTKNLETLVLGANNFYNLPGEIFSPLTNLERLVLSDCGITTIDRNWFNGLSNLIALHLSNNRIRELEVNVFHELSSLRELHIYNNQLLTLNRDAFGASLNSLTILFGDGNDINAFDRAIVTDGNNLNYLFLLNNFCVDLNFYDVSGDREFVLERLERCTRNFEVTPGASCDFNYQGVYRCYMTIENPIGVDFERIEGEHAEGGSDDEVKLVVIEEQNTRVIPNVICRQFGNLRRLQFYSSFLYTINAATFQGCDNLEHITLMGNTLPSIPSGSLQPLGSLFMLTIPQNNILNLFQGSFQGTAIEDLDLSWNLFTQWNQFWIYPITTTLRVLNLSHNRISALNPIDFQSAWNLQVLRLTDNPLTSIAPETFIPLANLHTLHLAACEINEIVPVWFAGKPNLRIIELDTNDIRDIPVNAFDVPSLQQLGLASNRIQSVDVLSFGSSLDSLLNIDLRDNQIEILDEHFLNNASALFSMELSGNGCADFDVIDIPGNLEEVRTALRPCFQAFEAITASCVFEEFEAFYACQLTLNNPQGKHRFNNVEGEHLGTANDNYVTYIIAENQVSRAIPEVLCRQYRNVEGIAFISSQLEFITPETFAGCEFLYSITLMMNNIRVIPSGAFRNNEYLASVRLDGNQIHLIAPDVFVGTQVYNLNLEFNRLTSLNRAVFEPIAHHLMFLDLRGNEITSLPRGIFAGMDRLYYLDLVGNNIQVIPSDSFHSTRILGRLFLADCGLRTLTARHFREKPFLWQLEVDNNQLTYLAPNVFNMPSLETLGVAGNQLEFIDASAFGASLSSLVFLSLIDNRIHGIDSFLLSSRTLFTLELQGNLCTDVNFVDIQNNLEVVRMYLNQCFINFRRRNDLLSCDYEENYLGYTCSLSLNNEEGHNDFPSVDGNHLTGRNDQDVVRVYTRNQFARRIPGRICQQFTNLRDLVIIESQIVEVTYQAFQHCRNLEYLNLNHNEIQILPPQFLINSPNLNTFTSYNNRIREIWSEAFLGTQLRYLDVNINRLPEFPQEAFEAVNETLNELFVDYNQIRTLPSQAFANLRNVQHLDLTGNTFDNIPSNAFVGLGNLISLSMTYCGLTRLDPAWFTPLTNLTVLYLSNNELSWLPFGVFAPLTNLFNLMLSANHLSELRIGSFNDTARNLWYLYADYNLIDGIEDGLLDELQSLQWLMLGGNICTQSTFMDVPNNLPQVRQALRQCTDNFRQNSIRCNYFGGGEGEEYFCILEIHNPDGREFERIEGDHVEGFGDSDVQVLNVFYQNTRNVPSVICRQFPNLNYMRIGASQLEFIFTTDFADCINLEQLFINQNRIQTVWPFSFANNRNLRILDLAYNEISFLHQSSFRNTSIEHLELAFNRLPTYNQIWCDDIADTLTFLDLSFNLLGNLPNGTFTNLQQLRILDIASNPIVNLPENAFIGLSNLETLGLSRTNIREVQPMWFESLTNLRTLYMQNNPIRVLPENVFSPLTSLTDLFLYGNQIREINRNSWGSGLSNLHRIYLGDNRINFFDQQFLIDANSLQYLLLAGNLCIDEDFLNVQRTYWIVFEALRQCTDNFFSEPWLSCNYQQQANTYFCQISVNNPRGLSFDGIEGEHVGGNSEANVTEVWGFYQNTMIVPSILCESFGNLERIILWWSNVEVINEETLSACRNLFELNLQFNWISEVGDFTFRNLPNFRILDLNMNHIQTLSTNSFTGSSLDYLDLALNQITDFNPDVFTPINETLRFLDLLGNNIITLPSDGLANLRNIERLVLNLNPLWNIPGDAFRFATNLRDLYLGSTGISEINPQWMQSLPALEELHIQNNNIGSFPNGIFSPLLRLRILEFYNNNVRSLSAAAFGQIQSLRSILAQNNRIRAFDPTIIDRASNLEFLMLSGNVCNNDDFFGVSGNREFVRQRLSLCFANSGPEVLQCRYAMYDEDYTCSLQIFNPLGREEFSGVEGEHLQGRGNNDVTHLYSAYGNTLNVPSAICQQFPNLVELSMLANQIEYIDSTSFEGCTRITSLWLYANRIEVIPNFVFINNPHLDTLIIENNQINFIGEFAFFNTALRFLDLAGNPLGEFNPSIVQFLTDTLRELNIARAGLTSLQSGSFDLVPNLVHLTLSNNRFESVPTNTFTPLNQLETLIMVNTNLRDLSPEWFETLTALHHLYVASNGIFELPIDIFNRLTSMTWLYIYNNNLRVLDTESFGASLPNLVTIDASFNEISGIDPTFLPTATNLVNLRLGSNNCTTANFYDVPANREQVETDLQECFDNYVGEAISCEYFENNGVYGCRLSINNPIGRDGFSSIPGNHLSGFSNEDVRVIDLMNQNTRNIPMVICQQFRNVEAFVAMNSNIDRIDSRAFSQCGNMNYVNLFSNNIQEIPANTFINNPALAEVELGMNRIEQLHPLALAGTAVEYIDLAMNQISVFDPVWFETVNGSLRTLDLLNNNIGGLQLDAFRTLRNIEVLVLSGNPLGTVPTNAFIALDELRILQLSNTNLRIINPGWFQAMRRLEILSLNNNEIESIPPNAFNSLTSIDTLHISGNFLWELNRQQFGAGLENLRVIDARQNVINIVDSSLVTSASNLRYLLLEGNICVDMNFSNVADYLWTVLEYLLECSDNFVLPSTASCQYGDLTAGTYMCTFSSHNPIGNQFASIDGDHVVGRNDSDVVVFYARNQNMRSIPTAVCRQFTNLREMMVFESRIERIDAASFLNCRNVQSVYIQDGLLRVVPDGTFTNAQNLRTLSLAGNRITLLTPNSLRGSNIEWLDLSMNHMVAFTPAAYEPINGTLRTLDLLGNRLTTLPYTAFENINGITTLILNHNHFEYLPFEFLYPLIDLDILSMTDCGLTELNHMWFYTNINLRQIYVQNNNLPNFQDGVFHNLTSLEVLYFQNNQIDALRPISFGNALFSIRILNGPSNQINAIDPDFIESATNLNYLMLNSNLCVDASFGDVQNNLDEVRAGLQTCFDNFENLEEEEEDF